MRDRDEIVDEIDGTDIGTPNPSSKSSRIQPGMADIEIEPSVSSTAEVSEMSQRSPWQHPAEAIGRFFEQLE